MTVLTVQRAWRIMDACGANAGGVAMAGGGDCRRGLRGGEGDLRGAGARGFDERSGERVTRR